MRTSGKERQRKSFENIKKSGMTRLTIDLHPDTWQIICDEQMRSPGSVSEVIERALRVFKGLQLVGSKKEIIKKMGIAGDVEVAGTNDNVPEIDREKYFAADREGREKLLADWINKTDMQKIERVDMLKIWTLPTPTDKEWKPWIMSQLIRKLKEKGLVPKDKKR
jgi:hypothetical protein